MYMYIHRYLSRSLRDDASRCVPSRGRGTYSLLVRLESDAASVRRLLEQVAEAGLLDAVLAQAVLEVCTKSRDLELAALLAKMLKVSEASQAPSFMALMRFYVEQGQPKKALELYDLMHKENRRRA